MATEKNDRTALECSQICSLSAVDCRLPERGKKEQNRMDFALDTIKAMTFKDKIIEVCFWAEG